MPSGNLLTRVANRISNLMHEAHRGVFVWKDHLLVFGNDGYDQDDRTRTYVLALRQRLQAAGFTVGEFAKCDGSEAEYRDAGYTWVLTVDVKHLPDEDEDVKPVIKDDLMKMKRSASPTSSKQRAAELVESILWECWGAAWGGDGRRDFQRRHAMGPIFEFADEVMFGAEHGD